MIGSIIGGHAVSVTLRRFAAGTRVLGRWAPGAFTDSALSCTVAPATGKDLLKLPEGDRTQEVKHVFSQTMLQLEPSPDQIVYRGIVYELRTVEDWRDHGGFVHALAVKKTAQTEGVAASTVNSVTHSGTGTVA